MLPVEVVSTMKGVPRAVDLVAGAILAGERIAIFGDYDADGVLR